MIFFLEKKYQHFLAHAGLGTFEAVWAKKMEWFEAPNVRRGGWSGVGKIALTAASGEVLPVFVKKQFNHGRLSLAHPFKGEPTFRREFANLRFLAEHQFLAPEVLLYAESSVDGKNAAVLVTKSLEDFLPLDTALETQPQQHRALVLAVAQEIRRFHALGMVHRALYPKHIFVQLGQELQVATIDMEKARLVACRMYATFFDLAALNRHTKGVKNTLRLRFFLTYMGVKRLGFWHKLLLRMILRRSLR